LKLVLYDLQKGIIAINPWHVPLLNTLVLVTSGAYITWCHYAILAGYRKDSIEALIYTILLAIFLQDYNIMNTV